jgi:2',3'-cyclic-nucleotide 2'-phosphodiesterase
VKILYIGDIMGDPGIETVRKVLPDVRKKYKPDLVIAQAENLSDGKGTLPTDISKLKKIGVDFFTGGNHTIDRAETKSLLEDPNQPVIGPANMVDCPGPGHKYVHTKLGDVLVISILGATFGRVIPNIDNSLTSIDAILSKQSSTPKVATIVNFHGDYSSQKKMFGHYLDGRVTAVIGDHWHVPTADAMVLPENTAYISDVGACCALHSSLGITFDSLIPRWRDNKMTKNILETNGPMQFNAVLITSDEKTGLAQSIEAIHRIIP